MDYWKAFLGSGAIAALVAVVGQLLVARQARKYAKQDKEEMYLKDLRAGMVWLMYDRIKYLGLHYIKDGAVDFDDLRVLREMHTVYHDSLAGNGDLDKIMREVDALPLKEGRA